MAQKDVIFRHSWTNPDPLPCGNIHWCAWSPSHLLPATATSIKSLPSDVLFQAQREEHILLFQDSVLFIWKPGELGWFFSAKFLFFICSVHRGNVQTLACPQADPAVLPAVCNHYSQLKTAFIWTLVRLDESDIAVIRHLSVALLINSIASFIATFMQYGVWIKHLLEESCHSRRVSVCT